MEYNFTYTHTVLGKELVVDLLPDGKNITVDSSNKEEYVRLVIEFLLVKKVEEQITALQKGLFEIIPFKALKIYSVE